MRRIDPATIHFYLMIRKVRNNLSFHFTHGLDINSIDFAIEYRSDSNLSIGPSASYRPKSLTDNAE